MTAATAETLAGRVWRALATVADPEFDEPITDLGIVAGVEVRLHDDRGHTVSVRLRLPASFCTPGIACRVVAGAHDAVLALPSVDAVDIVLEDRFAAEAHATDARRSWAFPARTAGEVRLTFHPAAHTACLERAVRKLVDEGWQVDAPRPSGRDNRPHRLGEPGSRLRFAKGVRIEGAAGPSRHPRLAGEVSS